MIIKKVFAFCVTILLISACNFEERDELPQIAPKKIELSVSQPEASFEVFPRGCTMTDFRIDIKKDYVIDNNLRQKEVLHFDLPNGEKATCYYENERIKKAVFDFITLIRTGNGKYKVQLTEKENIQKPRVIEFGFGSRGGISGITIFIK